MRIYPSGYVPHDTTCRDRFDNGRREESVHTSLEVRAHILESELCQHLDSAFVISFEEFVLLGIDNLRIDVVSEVGILLHQSNNTDCGEACEDSFVQSCYC